MNSRPATERETILNNLKEDYSYQIKNKLPKVKEIIKRILNKEELKILVIHHYDMDGYGVRMVWMYLEKLYSNLKVEYSIEPVKVTFKTYQSLIGKEYDYIIIGDLSIEQEAIENQFLIDFWSNNAIMIDHHISAFKFNDQKFAIVIPHDEKIGKITSGALLILHAFKDLILVKNIKFYRIITTIAAYDTYFFKYNKEISKEMFGDVPDMLNILFKYMKDKLDFANFFVDNPYNTRNIPEDYDVLENMFNSKDLSIINVLIEEREYDISEAEKNMQIVDIYPYKVALYYYSGKYVSEIGNSICANHPEVDYMLMINMNKKVCSLRCTKEINLVKELLTEIPGAGGHPKACGFKFEDNNSILEILKKLLGRED